MSSYIAILLGNLYLTLRLDSLQILGTTFIQHKSVYQPLFSSISPHEMMKSSDSEIWAGCPAEILYIISVLNNISHSKSLPIELTKHITFALNEFSPIKWAVQSHSPSLMKPRYHLASIYKQSAAIYLHQIIAQLPEDVKIDVNSPASLDSTVLHIQSINPEDPHFKGLVWPAFVIGAEAKETSQRMIVARVFEHLWDIWRCQNVRNALVVLQKLWAQKDENIASASWIDEIYRSGIDWIFV